ncbi:hypothetical protein FXO37_28535 [Capsicum annuum]|nr:hypothetical protein FXO37_28535 [Capsicum annuum]
MAATTMATAAGAVVLLYYVLSRRLTGKEGEEEESGDYSKAASRSVKRRLSRRPAQAPATWLETISTLCETLRFTYSETLGKWPIGDLAFGINFLIRRQGNAPVASVYAGESCLQLKGDEIIAQLYHYLRLVTLCMLFSKKPFPVFLESAGYSQEDVLLQKPKAGLLKPAFTIIRDRNLNCFLLLIRGTHSIKDTLTAATGAVVPFHHSVLDDGGVSNLVLGYAHCGMVAAARWIAKLSMPFLVKALEENPEYEIKIVGHSLGGGTAALLTYILREQKELSSSTCVTFAPGVFLFAAVADLYLKVGRFTFPPIMNEFKHHYNLRFGPPIRSQKLSELAKLRQIGSVTYYQEKFEQLVLRVGALTQSQKVELYISGLADNIAIEVELHNPPALATTMSLSRFYERQEQSIRSQLLDAGRLKTTDFSPQQHARFVKKLTKSEMEQRRLKGFCFNWAELLIRVHQCKKLFWTDFIDDEEEFAEKGKYHYFPHLALEDKRDLKEGSNVSTPFSLSTVYCRKIKSKSRLF